jgi:hypothetical protein
MESIGPFIRYLFGQPEAGMTLIQYKPIKSIKNPFLFFIFITKASFQTDKVVDVWSKGTPK